jgi:succinate dehydrogenase / fumarate reductase cytochrome b subunit
MRRIWEFWDSTIGKKVVMAATGIALVGFVVFHMAGNLQMFLGADAMREYAELLRTIPELLWIARAGLVGALVLHVISAAQLTMRNRASRPVGYAKLEAQASTFASRWMRVGGVFLLVFVIIHLGHFTTGWFNESMAHMQPYSNVVLLFKHSTFWVAFYVLAMVVLGLHLYHGIWAGARTLGLQQQSSDPQHHGFAFWLSLIVWAGFTVVPVAVALGFLD